MDVIECACTRCGYTVAEMTRLNAEAAAYSAVIADHEALLDDANTCRTCYGLQHPADGADIAANAQALKARRELNVGGDAAP